MSIRLIPLEQNAAMPTILVDRPVVLVGRHSECDVQIRSPKVSRKHCCLTEVPAGVGGEYRLAVRDLDSTNGTRINGEIISQGRLREGDELTIGAFRFTVVAKEPAAAEAADLSCEFPIPIPEPAAESRTHARSTGSS